MSIPQYTLIHKHRPQGNGGGVGFYIKNNINFKVIESLSLMSTKIFECITIEIPLSNKKISISSIYRSPTPPHNMTQKTQLEEFTLHFDTLLQTYPQNTEHHTYASIQT
jgi:hypothetical protein